MEIPSIAHPFTRDEVENFAQSVAPHVRLFMKYLCRLVTQDAKNKTIYNWSEEQVVEIQTLCDDVYLHQLLCHHLGDSSRSKNHTFLVTARGINNIPLAVVSKFFEQFSLEKKHSAAKSRKKPPPKRGTDQATSVNTQAAGQLVHGNPYPDVGKSPVDPLPNQSPHPLTMVPNYDHRLNTNGGAANGHLPTPQHSAGPSRTNHHNIPHASPGAATGRMDVPRAIIQTMTGESLTLTGIEPEQQLTSTMPYTPPDSAEFSTTTRLVLDESNSQHQGLMFPEHMEQSAVYNPPEQYGKLPSEAELHSHISPGIATNSSQSLHVPLLAQALNPFQPTHELPGAISRNSTWRPCSSSCPENSNLTSPVAPVPTRRSTQKSLAEIAAGDIYYRYLQQQPAPSSSHFGFPNPSPTPSPYSTLLPNTLDATLLDVGTPLSSSGAPTPLDLNGFPKKPTASMVPAENDAAAPQLRGWEPPPDNPDPWVLVSDHLPMPVGNTEQVNTRQVHDLNINNSILTLSFRENNPAIFVPFVEEIAAASGCKPLVYGPPSTAHMSGRNDFNQYVNEGREVEEAYARLTARQRESYPKASQKRKREQEYERHQRIR